MDDDEVLAAGFADQARIRAVARDVLADLAPHPLEDFGAAGEVHAAELRRIQEQVADLAGVAGDEVDHAGRHAGRLEQLERVVAAQHRGGGRLPDDRVAHQRGCGREVAADRGEVERRDGVDEAFDRPVLHLVPDAGAADRLLAVELLREVRVEAPEVDHLGRGVDLGLERRLRLAEHRRGVQRRAPGGGEQLGGAQHDGGAIFPGPAAPLAARVGRGGNRLRDVLRSGQVVLGQHVLVIVRHDRFRGAAGADLASADHERDVELLGRHRLEARLELGAFGRARRVRAVGIVDRLRHAPDPAERGNRRRARVG